jgi:hypothetical protein
MTVRELIDLAKNGELKQLAVKDDVNAIIGFINLGILELYKRFPLEEAEAIIWLTEGKTEYILDGTDEDVMMNPDKELLLITRVYDEQGEPVRINCPDYDNIKTVNTPRYNVVEVPDVNQDEYLSVIYRVTPKFLSSETDVLPIPPQLIEALLNYVGYRGHGAINGELKTENQSHYLRFDNSCKRVEMSGLIQSELIPSRKFDKRGFV